MRPVTVLLADDHELILDGLEALLAADEATEVVGRARTPDEVLTLARKLRPEVILMDYHFANAPLDGVDCVRELRELCPRISVVMLTQYDDHRLVIEALKAGAVGYVLKSSSREELMQAIIAARNGEADLPPSIQRKLIGELSREMPVHDLEAEEIRSQLTDRELQVVKLVVKGLRNADIARELKVGVSTIKTHMKAILDKFGSKDRTQMAVTAVAKGIVAAPECVSEMATRN
ncbi:MAG: response regulator [Armatimonadota bacterium]